MAPTQAAVHRAWLSLAQAWPVDRLRPKLQFRAAIGAAAQRIFDHPAASSPLTQAAPSTASTGAGASAGSVATGASGRPALMAEQCVKAEESVLALERLVKNDALNKVSIEHVGKVKDRVSADMAVRLVQYPMSDLTLRPASFPAHYDRIRDGIEKGVRGEARQPGLFDRFKWKKD